jgi:hypothetical protein
MIIVPYTHSTVLHSSIDKLIHKISILCQGGKNVWYEDNKYTQSVYDVINHILLPNDLITYGDKIKIDDNVYYCPIDEHATDITSMYSWNELSQFDTDTLCWRTFTIITNNDEKYSDSIFWLEPMTDNHVMNNIIKNIIKILDRT